MRARARHGKRLRPRGGSRATRASRCHVAAFVHVANGRLPVVLRSYVAPSIPSVSKRGSATRSCAACERSNAQPWSPRHVSDAIFLRVGRPAGPTRDDERLSDSSTGSKASGARPRSPIAGFCEMLSVRSDAQHGSGARPADVIEPPHTSRWTSERSFVRRARPVTGSRRGHGGVSCASRRYLARASRPSSKCLRLGEYLGTPVSVILAPNRSRCVSAGRSTRTATAESEIARESRLSFVNERSRRSAIAPLSLIPAPRGQCINGVASTTTTAALTRVEEVEVGEPAHAT